MMKVLITKKINEIAKDLLSAFFEVTELQKGASENELINAVKEYDAILSMPTDAFTPEIIDKAENLKVISNYAVGLDNIAVDYAKKKNLKVFNTPDVVTNSTADHTMALMLSLCRNVVDSYSYVKNDKWKAWNPDIFLGMEMHGKTLGIIGYGRIGKAVAKRAKGFGLDVIYYDSNTHENSDGLKQVDSIQDLYKVSDIISIHIPLTAETVGFVNEESFLMMKKKPFVINTSRGGVVNTADLTDALKNGKIQGAALDVTDPEPLSYNHELIAFQNCIITPHIGTATYSCRYNMAKLAAENIINYFIVTPNN